MAIDCHTLKVPRFDGLPALRYVSTVVGFSRQASARRMQVLTTARAPSSRPLHRYLVPGVLGALLLRSWLRSEMSAMWTGSAVPPATLEDESHSELCSYQEPSSGYSPTSSTSASQVN